jgi:hypothetical protein
MSERMERLQAEAARLNVAKAGQRDGLWQAVGAAAMVAGVALAGVAYVVSLNKADTRDIESLQIAAICMLALAVAGGAVFLRYSLARFLRFWLLRQLLEGQEHIDAVVGALSGPPRDQTPGLGGGVPSERYASRNVTSPE